MLVLVIMVGTLNGCHPAPAEDAPGAECCQPDVGIETAIAEPTPVETGTRTIPDVSLRDQRGEPIRFYNDLIKGRTVAINFVFTTCKGVCPPLGANFAALGRHLKEKGRDVPLISVSVDPTTDTPERLRDWAAQFNPAPGWTLVTGRKAEVDRLLRGLGVSSADKVDHSRLILLNDDASGRQSWIDGLASPEMIASRIESLRIEVADTPARRYFGDIRLVDQDGHERRLYADLMQGKTVLVQSFFCACRGSCPPMLATFARIQDEFGDRLGKDLHLLSISVDPIEDTPARLKATATALSARPGWFFLTGPKADVEQVLRKLGQAVEARENHSNLFIIGNDSTGLWKKAMGLAKPEEVVEVVRSVLDDRASAASHE